MNELVDVDGKGSIETILVVIGEERPGQRQVHTTELIPNSILVMFNKNLITLYLDCALHQRGSQMPRGNGIRTAKLQLTIDETTNRILSEMVSLGIHGPTKSQVATSVITKWIWDNQHMLKENGILLAKNKRI